MGVDGHKQNGIIEYKPSCKSLVAEIHKYFLVQCVIGRRTEIRKCLSCSSLIKSVKSGAQLVSSQPPSKRILEEKHGFAERVIGAIL